MWHVISTVFCKFAKPSIGYGSLMAYLPPICHTIGYCGNAITVKTLNSFHSSFRNLKNSHKCFATDICTFYVKCFPLDLYIMLTVMYVHTLYI